MELISPSQTGSQLWAGSTALPAQAGAGSAQALVRRQTPATLLSVGLPGKGKWAAAPPAGIHHLPGYRETAIGIYPCAAGAAPTHRAGCAALRGGQAGSSPGEQTRGAGGVWWAETRQRGLARRVLSRE